MRSHGHAVKYAGQVGVHRSEVVDLSRRRQYKDGRQEGGLHRQGDRDVVHIASSQQKLLGSRLAPVSPPDEDSEERGEEEEETEHEVVGPVEGRRRRNVKLLRHCFQLTPATYLST